MSIFVITVKSRLNDSDMAHLLWCSQQCWRICVDSNALKLSWPTDGASPCPRIFLQSLFDSLYRASKRYHSGLSVGQVWSGIKSRLYWQQQVCITMPVLSGAYPGPISLVLLAAIGDTETFQGHPWRIHKRTEQNRTTESSVTVRFLTHCT